MARGKIVDALELQLERLLNCDILPPDSYLAGGTAVYFYLKHRVSVDLDFFTPKNFNLEAFIHKMKECFDHVHVELMEKDTVILYISKEKIKFSLFFFPIQLLTGLQFYALRDNPACPLASLEDIEAMKAVAISQRGSVKDFVDLYFMLKRTRHSFDDILKLVVKKYGVGKEYEYQLRTAFVYFDDAEKEVDDIVMIKVNGKNEKMKKKEWAEIKNFFRGFME